MLTCLLYTENLVSAYINQILTRLIKKTNELENRKQLKQSLTTMYLITNFKITRLECSTDF